MRRVGLTVLGLLLLHGLAFGDWKRLLGKDAPVFATTWLRMCDGGSFDVLRGRAVVMVFWSAAGEAAGDDLFLIGELHERIYQKGGRAFALTDSAVERTREVYEAEGVLCSVGADTHHPEYGAGKLPYAYLVAPDGRVAWQGPLASLQPSTLDPVVRRSKPFVLPEMSKENKESANAFKKGNLIEATFWAVDQAARWKKDAKRLPDLLPYAQLYEAEANCFVSLTELCRVYWWGLFQDGIDRGDYDRALYGLDLIQRHLDAAPFGAKELGVKVGDGRRAAAEAKKLDTPEVKRSLEASKALAALVAAPIPSTLTEKAKSNRLAELEEFQKEWEGTYAAKRAARRARWISGLPTKG
ncbi:MAG TPA: hypothetical protein VFY93_08160 [Planctomycetota bacterium]|nr:hypothetical protein [Planctomycetota bacterium]